MIAVRSFAFQVLFFGWTILVCTAIIPLLWAPRLWMQKAARVWTSVGLWLLRVVAGVRHEVRGAEHLPKGGPAVIVAKHQSMWDTLIFHVLLPDPAYILKKELAEIPFFGWYLMKSGCVSVDRGAGAKALRQMIDGAKAALERGSQVVIFPEGTRTAPGSVAPYHSGVALLTGLGHAVVPVALNSGLFWGRHTFLRKPGTIVLEAMAPLDNGLDRKAAMRELESRIESNSRRLVEEALAEYPHLSLPQGAPAR